MRGKNKRNHLLLILFFIILALGLGYALLTQDLKINGITTLKGGTWDIHFENVQVLDGSVVLSNGDSAATIDITDDTLVEYTVTLKEPGDYYEFTVDVVNAGTIDGMIGSIIKKYNGVEISSTNPLPVLVLYTVSYDDGDEIIPNHKLEVGDTETYKIRVEYNKDIDASEFSSMDQQITLSFGLNYVQADNSSSKRRDIIYIADSLSDTYLGQSWDSTNPFYTTPEAASSRMLSTLGTDKFYIKIVVKEGIITDGFIIFTITDQMAQADSNLTPGTYTLRGGGATFQNSCYQPDSVYYEDNKDILNTAFGASNCNESSVEFHCYSNGFSAFLTPYGSIHFYDPVGVRLPSCGVQQFGSHCDSLKTSCFDAGD